MTTPADDAASMPRSDRLVTIPNALCVVRFLGSFVMMGLAIADQQVAFLWLFVVLAGTDWLDGKLAVLLDARTEIGPQLDSWADSAMFFALLAGTIWMQAEAIWNELAIWLVPLVLAFLISTAAGFRKFGRWPSYHTRTAKFSWWLTLIGAVCFLAGWSVWVMRIALVAATIANVEALVITLILKQPRSDLRWVFDVLGERVEGDRAIE